MPHSTTHMQMQQHPGRNGSEPNTQTIRQHRQHTNLQLEHMRGENRRHLPVLPFSKFKHVEPPYVPDWIETGKEKEGDHDNSNAQGGGGSKLILIAGLVVGGGLAIYVLM